MDYEKLYKDLIESRRNRVLYENEYYEKHHIVPKCLKGTNKKENLVYLTAKEHFLAHHLLYKCAKDTNEKMKLGSALHYLCYGNSKQVEKKITARQYEISKKIFSESMKNRIAWNKGLTDIYSNKTLHIMSKKAKERLKNKENHPQYNKQKNEESKQKQRQKLIGKPTWNKGIKNCFSQKTIEKMRKSKIGKPLTEEHKKNISIASKKREYSEEFKQKCSASKTGNKNPNYGKIWICKENEKSKCIFPNELEEYKMVGWIKGKTYVTTRK